MAGVNKVILVGNLGRDPELKHFDNGNAMCTMSIATSEEWKDKNTGEKKEKTEWHRVVTFSTLAENCGKYMSKGRQIYLEGKIQTREWEKDGEKRYTTEIVAQTVQFLGTKGDDQGQQQASYGNPEVPQQQQGNGYGQAPPSSGGYAQPEQPQKPDDDIPF